MYRLTLLLLSWLSFSAAAIELCSNVFPDPVSSYSGSGTITIQNRSRVVGSDGNINFQTITDNSGNQVLSCISQNCRSSGETSPRLSLPAFQNSSSNRDYNIGSWDYRGFPAGDYKDVFVGSNAVIDLYNANTTYRFNKLQLGYQAVAYLRRGDYWINELIIGSQADLYVYQGGTVRIHANKITLNDRAGMNTDNTPDSLVIFNYDNDIEIGNRAVVNSYMYTQKKVTFNNRARLVGALVSNEIILNSNNSRVTYDANNITEADFGSACSHTVVVPQPLPDPTSHWTFDMCNVNGTAGEIVDIVSSRNGKGLGGTQTENGGPYCQAMQFNGVDGHVNIAKNSGFKQAQGAVSMWFNAANLTTGPSAQALFSRDSSGFDNGGHLTIWVTSSRSVVVRHQSTSADNYAYSNAVVNSDTWHHLVYTWGDAGMKVYLDDNLVASNAYTGGIQGNDEPIILGASAISSGNGESLPVQLGDFFSGQMDDVRFYDSQLTADNVVELGDIAAGECRVCNTEPVLQSHWPIDVCSVNGTAGEIVDIVNGNNGAALNGAKIDADGRFCQAAEFLGNQEHINIANLPSYQTAQGGVSFWFRRNVNTAGNMALFSKDSGTFDDGGHLTIWSQEDGKIYVRHQSDSADNKIFSSANTVTQGQWHHLVYTWGSKGMKLYVDNNLVGTHAYTGGISANKEPIILGASAIYTQDEESAVEDLVDFFVGDMDDIRLYTNHQVEADLVNTLYNQSQYNCAQTCPSAVVMESHWPIDVCNVDGTAGEIVDVLNGHNGVALNGADIEADGKFCQAAEFLGNKEHISIGNVPAFATSEGGISFWFKRAIDASGNMALFSKDSSTFDDGGHLTIWSQSDGRIRVRHQSASADNDILTNANIVANDKWHHLMYTWGGNGMQLYLDSTLIGSNGYTGGVQNNPEPIILGASAISTNNNASPVEQLTDFFAGEMDDIRFFRGDQPGTDIVERLYKQSEYSCAETCVVEPVLESHWPIDVCSVNGTAGEVVDIINGHNGAALNNANIEAEGRFCQAGQFAGNQEHISIGHHNNFMADEGGLSFWFRRNVGASGDMALFSKDSETFDKGGHLTIWAMNDGKARVRLQSSSANHFIDTSNAVVTPGQWHHLAFAWGSDGMTLYIDNVEVGTNAYTGGLDGNPEPIILGASAIYTANEASPVGQLQDFFAGEIDDIRLYTTNPLRAEDVETLYNQSQYSCEFVCNTDPVLTSHWPIDVCSVEGTSGEIVDIISGINGTALNNASIDVDGKFCQAIRLMGNQEHISIPHNNVYASGAGGVSFWFRRNAGTSGDMAMLSKDSSNFDKGGHLTIWAKDNDSVQVRLQSTTADHYVTSNAAVISKDQWHHLAFSWGGNGMVLYLDNQVVASTGYTGGLAANEEPIIIGADATTTPDDASPVAQLKEFFSGDIDDIRLYTEHQLRAEDVTALYNQADYQCTTCQTDPVLEAHWPVDVCALDGSANEIIDIINSHNGQSLGDLEIDVRGKYCQALDFLGSDEHVNIPHFDEFATRNGGISFWFKRNLNTSGDMALFSKDSLNFDGGGHLTIWARGDGTIDARLQSDSADNYASTSGSVVTKGQWHHLVFTWGFDGMVLYLDNQIVATNSYTGGTAGNAEPIILGAGANRTNGTDVSAAGELLDFFAGQMDDIRFYRDFQPGATLVAELYNQASYTCNACDLDVYAYYQFEENSWNAPGTIIDSSGNGRHASPLGTVNPIFPSEQVACKVLDVEFDSSSAPFGIDTGIEPDADLNGRGTISFWYRSDEKWDSNNARQLFDASTPIGSDEKYFHLTLLSDSRLLFGIEDDRDADFRLRTGNLDYAAGEWVHVAVTFDTRSGAYKIYLNGDVAASAVWNGGNGTIGEVQTLYFGDSRSNYLVGGMTERSANGQFDEVRIYDVVQLESEIEADIDKAEDNECGLVHHYRIIHPEEGYTCAASTVNFQACTDANCSQTTGTANLNLTPVNTNAQTFWAGGDSVSIGSSGTASKEFSYLDNGPVQIGASVASGSPDAPIQCYSSNDLANQSSCSINFKTASLVIDWGNAQTIPGQVAGIGLNETVRISSDSGGVCNADLAGKSVEVAVECVSPNSCPADASRFAVNGNLAATTTSYTNTSVTFGSNGEAVIPANALRYDDAGQIRLNVRAADNSANGASNNFFVAPQLLTLSSQAAVPQTAGADFGLQVTAINAFGNTTPNYQPGELAFSMQRISPDLLPGSTGVASGVISVNNTQPSGTGSVTLGDNGSIDEFFRVSLNPTFVAGVSQNPDQSNNLLMRYSEVGRVALDVSDLNYGGAQITTNGSLTLSQMQVGRFIPSHFEVESSFGYAGQCGTFVYRGQAFAATSGSTLRFTAKNAQGDTTTYYDSANAGNSAFGFSGTALFPNRTYVEQAGRTVQEDVSAAVATTENADYDGSFVFNMSDVFNIAKGASPEAPLEAGAYTLQLSLPANNLLDSDGVGYKTAAGDPNFLAYTGGPVTPSVEVREGRLHLANASGADNENLAVPLTAQYFDGNTWITNTLDSCYQYDAVDLRLTETGQLNDFGADTLSNGSSLYQQQMEVVAPNAVVEYQVEYAIPTGFGFLRFDWDPDSDGTENPTATLSFGQYRGNDRIIHWREVF